MTLDLLVGAAAVLAGAIASVAGFGIGSVLTPAFGLAVDTKVAVAAVAIPHFIGTAQRYWMLRAHVDRRMLLGRLPQRMFRRTVALLLLALGVYMLAF